MKLLLKWAAASVITASIATTASAQDLGEQAVQILTKNCRSCHGAPGKKRGGIDYVDDVKLLIEHKQVVPGNPEQSEIYLRMSDRDDPMPPPGKQPRPTNEDVALIKKWIEAGAPAPKTPSVPPRPFVALNEVLSSIDKHLERVQEEDRPFKRYFSLTHLHNLKKAGSTANAVSDSEYRLYQAALSKLLNSLSWKPDIVLPEAIDTNKTVFAVDLRDLDWDEHGLWKEILRVYPYGLKHDTYPEDNKTNELAKRITSQTQSDVPILRADWFIGNASLPPLYHVLLKIPETSQELERQLKVDIQANFRRNKLVRAGFSKSGVSAQNRLMERHSALYGAYWISYDFKPKNPRGNLFRYPLGPKFPGNPFERQAFEHDGGEIIFNLPNGLQAYMLIDAEGNRIDKGPIDIVRDSQELIGSPEIINGVSCMACHRHGMKDEFEDTVRLGTAVADDAKRKVQLLYPQPEAINELVAKDKKRFVDALDKTIGPFLKVDEKKTAEVEQFGEPVAKIVSWYLRAELGANELTAELGMEDPKQLTTAIKFNAKLRALGLGPIASGATIKRETWEEFRGTSVFQKVCIELERGTPVVYPKRKP